MTDYTTRFNGDAGIEYFQSDFNTGSIHLPDHPNSPEGDESLFLGHMSKAMAQRPSMDVRLRQALRPVVSDMSVLKPEKYRVLLTETHAALVQQRQNERDEAAKEAMSDLITLLEENFALSTLLDQNANLVHKA